MQITFLLYFFHKYFSHACFGHFHYVLAFDPDTIDEFLFSLF